MIIPKKLAIYYGVPVNVNGSTTVSQAVNIFKDYNIVVFGQGFEQTTNSNNISTKSIILDPLMINTHVYGYVDSSTNFGTFQSTVLLWKAMGVKGIFCDKFGYDSGVTRNRQNMRLDNIHSLSLTAFVNASNPDDVFSPA